MHSKWFAGQPARPVPAQPSGGRSAAQVEVGGVAGKSVVTSPLYKTILSFYIELSYVKKLAYFFREKLQTFLLACIFSAMRSKPSSGEVWWAKRWLVTASVTAPSATEGF